jgi:4-hydroxy-3-methylbut-2-enyl diphosphate reductase IspH
MDMEAALDRVSKALPVDQHDHRSRTFVANKIIACVVGGASTPDAMTRAALEAVTELSKRSANL